MSMLTVQANHLREMAYTVERVKNDAVGKLSLSGSITLATAAMDMRDAADTIARLRNTCHDLQHENKELKAENAKLRELCGDLFNRLRDKDEHCGECRSQCEHDAWNFGDPKCVYAKRLKEVGIEVGDAPDEPMSDAARRVFDRLMSELDGDEHAGIS